MRLPVTRWASSRWPSGGSKSTFVDNLIAENGYAVKVGFEQVDDLSFGPNYWGTKGDEELFFDKTFDPQLGEVIVKERLDERVEVPPPFFNSFR